VAAMLGMRQLFGERARSSDEAMEWAF